MFIKILGKNNIIINGVEYFYIKQGQHLYIRGIDDEKIIGAVKYALKKTNYRKKIMVPPSFRDVRADGRTMGVIYMQTEGVYIGVASTINNLDYEFNYFSHERLAKHWIITEGFKAPEIDVQTKDKNYMKRMRRVYPGCFNMVYCGHDFAGFTFSRGPNQFDAYNMQFTKRTFNNYPEAESWVKHGE